MQGEEFLVLLGLAVVGAIFATPILAIMAWVRVRRLERRRPPPPDQSSAVGELLERLRLLELRLNELESGATKVAPTPVAAEAPAAPAPTPVVEPVAVPVRLPAPEPQPVKQPVFTSPPPSTSSIDLESQIAGRWMNRIGLIAVAVGMSYFLKYTIDNDWIGPAGQVAIGLLIGAGLMTLGPVFARRGHAYFADGITGLGAVVLYLSLWAAGSYYALLSQTVVFIAMIVVTAAVLAIAVGRNSQRVAVLAMIGGFMTPILVSTGRDQQVVLFSYIALHNGAVLALARARNWRFIELPALAFTQVYFWGWFDRYYTSERVLSTLAFATLFFTEFAAVPVIRSRRAGVLHAEQALLLVVNAGVMLLALHQTLWPDWKWALTFATLALAAVHLVFARVVPASASLARLIFAGLALSLVTIAVPIRVSTRWITMAWAIEAVVIMWTGVRARLWYLRTAAYVVFTLVALRLLVVPLFAEEFLFNARFATFLVVAAAVAASVWFATRGLSDISKNEQTALGILAVGFNVLVVVALTSEVSLFYRSVPGDVRSIDHRLAEGVTVSVLWALYSSGLVFAGVRWSRQMLRWQGLILLGLTTMKVFFVDLSMLSGFYRVMSSVAVGVILLIISFVYQRRLASRAPEPQ